MTGHIIHIFLFFFAVFASSCGHELTTSLGKIAGKRMEVQISGTNYSLHQYLGIPFAKPQIADNRFQKAELRTSLESPFNAQSPGPRCPELDRNDQNEDCLFLNIYVPDQAPDPQSGHAVMVWFHGGGFQRGTSSDFEGNLLSTFGNIIVVTINYRLGAFGFLSTGDDNAPGNVGLWDQRLALEWVNKYIKEFGGDSQRVTIAGVSAGAISSIQHALYPENRGLFQRVIAQSGSVTMPILDFERNPSTNTLTLAKHLECDKNSMAELISCLKRKSVAEIFSAIQATGLESSFTPVIDGSLIKRNPQHLGNVPINEIDFFRSVDFLSGFNEYVGTLLLSEIIGPQQENIQPTQEEMVTKYLPIAMESVYRKSFNDELLNLIHHQYTDWTNPYDYKSIRLQITRLLGDTNFAVPAVELARFHGDTSQNFMYYFTPSPSNHLFPKPSWIDAAAYGEEISFLFGAAEQLVGTGTENEWEMDLSLKMMGYWANFIKSGDPNKPEPITPYWPQYSPDTGDYLFLEKTMSNDSAKQHFFAEEVNFWLTVFPDLADRVTENVQGSTCSDLTNAGASFQVGLVLLLTFMLATVMILQIINYF